MSKLNAVPAALRGRLDASRSVLWAVVGTCLVMSSVAFGKPLAPSYIYGIDDSKNLWEMDVVNASAQNLFQANFSGTGLTNGLAFDTDRNDMFVVDSDNNLYWWRQGATNFSLLASGSTLGIGTVDSQLSTQPWGAAYYDNAYWFFRGSGNPDNTLLGSNVLEKVTLDYTGGTPTVSQVTTYTATQISGSNAFGDIAITPDGTLFAYTTQGAFYSLDLTTASSGTVGGYNLLNTPGGSSLQIAFSSDYATLYGHSFGTSNWYAINTSNGDLSPIASPAPGQSFRDLGGSAVQAVPEPSTLALAAMGGVIAAWHVARRRRHRQGGTLRDGGAAAGLRLATTAVAHAV